MSEIFMKQPVSSLFVTRHINSNIVIEFYLLFVQVAAELSPRGMRKCAEKRIDMIIECWAGWILTAGESFGVSFQIA